MNIQCDACFNVYDESTITYLEVPLRYKNSMEWYRPKYAVCFECFLVIAGMIVDGGFRKKNDKTQEET